MAMAGSAAPPTTTVEALTVLAVPVLATATVVVAVMATATVTATAMVLAIFFGALFSGYLPGFDGFEFIMKMDNNCEVREVPGFLHSLYFSIVTFTTLGFGDVTAYTLWGKFWVCLEVVIGYMMLGGLISIFSNKMTRIS